MLRITDVVGLAAGALVAASSAMTVFVAVTSLPLEVAPPCTAWTGCPGESFAWQSDLTSAMGILVAFAIGACLVLPLLRITLGRLASARAAGLYVIALGVALFGLVALEWHTAATYRWLTYAEWNYEFLLRASHGYYGMVLGLVIALAAAVAGWAHLRYTPVGGCLTIRAVPGDEPPSAGTGRSGRARDVPEHRESARADAG